MQLRFFDCHVRYRALSRKHLLAASGGAAPLTAVCHDLPRPTHLPHQTELAVPERPMPTEAVCALYDKLRQVSPAARNCPCGALQFGTHLSLPLSLDLSSAGLGNRETSICRSREQGFSGAFMASIEGGTPCFCAAHLLSCGALVPRTC